MSTPTSDPIQLWNQIQQAGGIRGYIDQQLRDRGFLVTRRDVDEMSDREKDRYKKELKQEAAEKKKLKQDAWKAYRATHLVHLGEGIFWNDEQKADKWDTPNSEERAAENELPNIDRPEQLAPLLGITLGQLRQLAYHREAATLLHYRRFFLKKRDGSQRPIWAPLPRLKAVQRWILHNIVERLPVHGSAHGFLVGRSIATNAHQHTNSQIVLKMDVKEFFPTVTWRRVMGVFRRAGYREHVAKLLALLCTEAPREIVELDGKTYYVSLGPRCLPQGAPTSPGITNALCLRLDRRITALAKRYGWRYSRYADDLTFSLPHGATPVSPGTIIGIVTRIAKAEGFTIKREKTRIARVGRRQTVTGLVVNRAGPPRTPRSVRRQLRAVIHNLQQDKPLPEGETLAHWEGMAAYVAMTQPELGRKFLDQLQELNP